MRDIDAAGMGHNTNFLTRISGDVLNILTDAQKDIFINLAVQQYSNTTLFARMRLAFMDAFRRNMTSPHGTAPLSFANVKAYSAGLYALDGDIAFKKAQATAAIILSLTDNQVTLRGF